MPNRAGRLLPDSPAVAPDIVERIADDYNRIAATGPLPELETYLFERYGIDIAADYGGIALKNPWGKASGQLSMTARQVAEDVAGGLGFIVLKTVIAEDESGRQTMGEWAFREARMLVEPIVGQRGTPGWTVSWKGRGWWQSLDKYLELVRAAREIAAGTLTLIVPSCKFHLPTAAADWNTAEYAWTTRRLLEAWRRDDDVPGTAMPLEKDFSPTLAGSDRAEVQTTILNWLRRTPLLIRQAAGAENPVRVGLKLFNALFDDEFQIEMLRTIHTSEADRPDYYVYGNRLFDPHWVLDGHRGIAYGGPDLSDRNLRVLDRFQHLVATGAVTGEPIPWSGTGDIGSGKMALEYALRGASSFQLHTYFQLPADLYRMSGGTRTQKALHELYFHPADGLIVWMHHLAGSLGLSRQPLRFRDLIGRGPELPPRPVTSGI